MFLGGSVTYVALQLAFFMGFDPVILIGVDHSYTVTRSLHEKISYIPYDAEKGNHFAPNYYEEGDRWIAPDIEKQELGYRIAKYMYEREGRQILDATVGGKLDIFPKIDYYSLF
jgi:hypothetical protein